MTDLGLPEPLDHSAFLFLLGVFYRAALVCREYTIKQGRITWGAAWQPMADGSE